MEKPPHREWLPWGLRPSILIAFVSLTLSVIAAILVLAVYSARFNGFATITELSFTTMGFNVSLGLLWTSLPALAFQLFAMTWDWIASSFTDRQPYVELYKGAEAKKTVLLEYRCTPVLWRWCKAFRNSHMVTGASLLLALVLSVVVSPLSARLFATQNVLFARDISLFSNSTFNSAAINDTIDWSPVLSIVSATRIHHGGRVPWTDQQYAFLPQYPTSPVSTNAEYSFNTTAYVAYLNCALLSDYTLTLTPSGSSDAQGTVTMNANDRGCAISHKFGVSETQDIYFKTTSEISCSAAASYSRLVFTAARYDASSANLMKDISVISCATGYRQVNGELKMSPPPSEATSDQGTPIVRSFIEKEVVSSDRPAFWRVFEEDILGPVSTNPKTEWSTTDFGSLILYYAQTIDSANFLSADILMQSIPDMYSELYLTTVALRAFYAGQNVETGTGRLLQPLTRLYVTVWVACLIIVVLTAVAVVAISVLMQVAKNPSILTDEPNGLFSYAGILEGSSLLNMAKAIREEHGYDGKFQERSISTHGTSGAIWKAYNEGNLSRWIIRN